MARDFDGLTDKIEFTLADTVTYSIYASFIADQIGDNDFPRILGVPSGASDSHPLGLNLPVGQMFVSLRHSWTTLHGQWRTPIDSIVLDTQHRVCATYDGGDAGNDAILYLDGTSPTITRIATPSGTRDSIGGTATLGNTTGQTRTLDGVLAEFGWWNRVLSAGEGLALTNGYSPKFFPRGLVHYVRMIRGVIDEVGGAAMTITGTTVVPHPRTIYPAPTRIIHVPAAVAVGNPWHVYAQQ